MTIINNPLEINKITVRLINADEIYRKEMERIWREVARMHTEGKLNDQEYKDLCDRIHSKVTAP